MAQTSLSITTATGNSWAKRVAATSGSMDNGVLFAVLSATGFSLKAVFVKLAYAAAPVDTITVLSLTPPAWIRPVANAILSTRRYASQRAARYRHRARRSAGRAR